MYVVIARTQALDPKNSSSSGGLFYCGLARKWWEGDCKSAQVVCSSPGPMFYFPVGQAATILFVNDIDPETVNWVPANCYDADSDDLACTVTRREAKEGCTYYHPTDYQANSTSKYRVNNKSIPISPHIHGL